MSKSKVYILLCNINIANIFDTSWVGGVGFLIAEMAKDGRFSYAQKGVHLQLVMNNGLLDERNKIGQFLFEFMKPVAGLLQQPLLVANLQMQRLDFSASIEAKVEDQ